MNTIFIMWLLSLIGSIVSLILRARYVSDAFLYPAALCGLSMLAITFRAIC